MLARLVHPVEQAVPHPRVAAEPSRHPPVSGCEQPVRRDRVAVARAAGHTIGVDVEERARFEARGDAFERGDLDLLTAASPGPLRERQQRSDRTVEPGEVPRLVRRRRLRWCVRPPDLGRPRRRARSPRDPRPATPRADPSSRTA